ncbi:DUF1622 domain-containing protein [Psychrobacter sp.]|uniref:DUF1622 domain-containing protein n=1 Tax=Psychrobacter sp. TaxID=56811 RepID=UPI0025CCC88A|nr:DUF1622 domain-containing protein [Psychrobacter sp.]
MEYLIESIDFIAKIVEFVGVMIMFLGLLMAFVKAAMSSTKFSHDTYLGIRQGVGKSILLGLEVLIAADIMATVVTEPTLRSVVVLGVIVIIRTFLSLSLQVELEGRFPWQKEDVLDKSTMTNDNKTIYDNKTNYDNKTS